MASGQAKDYPPCSHQPTENDIGAAKGAYRAGQLSFQEADYERALLYWEDAFRRDCTAVKLLLNIARAYELSGDRPSAVHALRTYIERDPEAEERASVEKRIEKLNEKIAQAEAAAKDVEPPQEAEASLDEHPKDAQNGLDREREKSWPVAVTVGGAAVTIAGGVLIVFGSLSIGKKKDEIADDWDCTRDGRRWECPTDQQLESAQAALESDRTIKNAQTVRALGIAAAGVGAIATTIGAYYWTKLWKGTSQGAHVSSLQWSPVVSKGFGGLQLSGSF